MGGGAAAGGLASLLVPEDGVGALALESGVALELAGELDTRPTVISAEAPPAPGSGEGGGCFDAVSVGKGGMGDGVVRAKVTSGLFLIIPHT